MMVDGLKLSILNDLDIAVDGTVYFTESTRFSRKEFVLELLEGKARGRLASVLATFLCLFMSKFASVICRFQGCRGKFHQSLNVLSSFTLHLYRLLMCTKMDVKQEVLTFHSISVLI